jgi:hypothetical protein
MPDRAGQPSLSKPQNPFHLTRFRNFCNLRIYAFTKFTQFTPLHILRIFIKLLGFECKFTFLKLP